MDINCNCVKKKKKGIVKISPQETCSSIYPSKAIVQNGKKLQSVWPTFMKSAICG